MNCSKFSVDVETIQPILGTLPREKEKLKSMLDYKVGSEAFKKDQGGSLFEKVSDQLELIETSEFGHFGIKRRPADKSRFSEISKRALVVDYRWLKTVLLTASETYFGLAGFNRRNGMKREEYKNNLEQSLYIEPRFIPLRRRKENGNFTNYLRAVDGTTKIYGEISGKSGKTSIASEHDYLLAPLFFNFGLMITNSTVISTMELLKLLAVSQEIGIGGVRKLDFGNFEIKSIIKEGDMMSTDLTDEIRSFEQENYRKFKVQITTQTPLLGGTPADKEEMIRNHLSNEEEEEDEKEREEILNVLPTDEKGRPCLKQCQVLAMLRDAARLTGLSQQKRMDGFKTQLREGGMHLDKDRIPFTNENGEKLTEPDGTKILEGNIQDQEGQNRSIVGEYEFIDAGRKAEFTLHVLNTAKEKQVVEDEDVKTLLGAGQRVGLGSVRNEFGDFKITKFVKLD